ncbi:DMT family transporter [Streptomyces sp. SudanB182_2057]|uniref:DMT family transporter n=1 Tax=Streptomyces sp. SudanB182_2057 TaxID=3035281 RepID=UPI003F565FD8
MVSTEPREVGADRASGSERFVSGVLPILLAGLLWGSTGTAASFAPAGASALSVGAANMGIGGLVLLVVAGRSVLPVLRGGARAWRTVLGGAAAVAVYPLAYYTSMHLTGIATGTVVTVGSTPAFTKLCEVIGERALPRARWVGASAVSTAGVALVVAGQRHPADGPHGAGETAVGVALGLLAGAAYAVYSYSAGRLIRRGAASRSVMGLMFGLGGLMLVPVLVVTGGPLLSTRSGLLVAGYLALVPMALAYLLFGRGLGHVTASTAATLILVEPVAAAVLSVVVAGEHLDPLGWAGIVLVGVGLLILDDRE